MLQKIDTLYLFIGRILDVVAVYLLLFFPTIMFHTSFIKCFTNLPTISWVVMFHVKHYVV